MPLLNIRISGLSLLPPSARRADTIIRICLRALACRPAIKGLKPRGEVNIVFLDRKKMLDLNKKYLDHSHDTDVIAFNYEPGPAAGPDEPFGDVYISAHMARRQAKELGHDVLKETLTLAAHGCLHLIGYEDSTPSKKAVLFRLQEAAVKGC